MADEFGCARPKRDRRQQRTQALYGAWREPKVLIVYVVDAEGKREARFAPFIDATLKRAGCGVCLAAELLAATRDHPGGSGPLYRRRGAVDMETGPVARPSVRLSREQVHELLDFLSCGANTRPSRGTAQRLERESPCPLRTQQRRLLLQARWCRSLPL